LHDLTKKDVPFIWDEGCEKSFQTLKEHLTGAGVLSLPDPNVPAYILDTDASNYAIGAVLSQMQEGEERVIAYGSRCLDAAEKNYCVTRKELLAVVYFMDYFRHYLLGAETVVRTDHGSLQWLKQMKNPSDQVARWVTKLEAFHWKIQHRPGRNHGNADAMSRRLCEGDCPQCQKILRQTCHTLTEKEEDQLVVQCLALTVGRPKKRRQWKRRNQDLESARECQLALDRTRLIEETGRDPLLQRLKAWTTRPGYEDVSGCSPETRFYWKNFDNWRVDDSGLIWYGWIDPNDGERWKLVIPRALCPEILKAIHDTPLGGHLGEKRCLHTLRRLPVFWYEMKSDLKYHCRMCDQCFRCKAPNRRWKAPMRKYTVGEPLQRMAIDVAGPFHVTDDKNQYIVVAMDYFTKWACLAAVPKHDARICAKVLVEEVFCKIGIPAEIHSDQGREFISELFVECCNIFQVNKTRTTPWRPQSDGMVERLNRTVGQMLRQYVSENQQDWDRWLPLCGLAYNGSVHSSTGYTPFFLMFGRELRLPVELVLPPPDNLPELQTPDNDSGDVEHFVGRMRQALRHVYGLVRDNLNQAARLQKHQYDRNSIPLELSPGQGVWLFNPKRRKGRTPKLDIPWEGPYTVLQVRRGVLVDIQLSRHSKPRVVHIDKLAPVRQPFDGSWIKHLNRKGRGPDDQDLALVPELFRQAEKEREAQVPQITPTPDETAGAEPEAPTRGKDLKHRPPPKRGQLLQPRGRRPLTRSQTRGRTEDPG
jgi:hypothetical protein